jgi:hypothetical protein
MAINLCHFVVLSLWTIGNLPPERDPRSTWLLVETPGVPVLFCTNVIFL